MLMPKRTKYRKMMKGKRRGLAHRGSTIAFGDYGLQALDCGWITSRQIEATRVAITRRMKRKGAPEYWVAVVKPGRILFEINGVDLTLAKKALSLGAAKLPFKTRIISRLGE